MDRICKTSEGGSRPIRSARFHLASLSTPTNGPYVLLRSNRRSSSSSSPTDIDSIRAIDSGPPALVAEGKDEASGFPCKGERPARGFFSTTNASIRGVYYTAREAAEERAKIATQARPP